MIIYDELWLISQFHPEGVQMNSKTINWKRFIILTMILVIPGFLIPGQNADLVLTNGNIHTVDQSNPTVSAIAIIDDKIAAVGSDQQISKWIGPGTRIINLKGKTAIPGFIESHGHFVGLGKMAKRLDLKKAKNWGEIITMVKDRVKKVKPGTWIIGRGWHQEKWNRQPVKNHLGLPYHDQLSHISSKNPVLLHHASGHAIYVNRYAMDLCGISSKTGNPAGGEIVRDNSGKLVGVFRENAENLILKYYNLYLSKRSALKKKMDLMDDIRQAQNACFMNGVTTFHDAGTSFSVIDVYRKMADNDDLKIRLNVMIGEDNQTLLDNLDRYRIHRYANNRLTVGAIKRLFDGALGSHGAWMLKPYLSLPDSTGLNTETIAVMEKTAEIAMKYQLQLCTHAIGDRANREILNIYERAFKKNPRKTDLRWRVEHAQHLDEADIPRFSKLGVIAAMQAIHCTSDGPWVEKRIGKHRAKSGAYVWRKLIKSGALICNGTDVPVENIDPIACFYASVTRRSSPAFVFYPGQKMSRMEALRSYTINGAVAAFEEDIKGSLKTGKLADITVLSQDIMAVPEEEIMRTRIVYTILGGKMVFDGS